MSVLDELYKIHYSTLPVDIDVRAKLHTDKFLSFRLGKYSRYILDVKNQNLSISFRTLINAYITKLSILDKRKKSAYADLDFMITYDAEFYKGIWDLIITLSVPNEKLRPFTPFQPEDIDSLDNSEFIKLSPKKMIAEYKSFYDKDVDVSCFGNLLNSLPLAFRPCRTKFNMPIKCMIECFKLDFLNTPEPFDGFWIYYANLWWRFMHWNMRTYIKTKINMFNKSMVQYKNYSSIYQNN
jgi:hypothetical protein